MTDKYSTKRCYSKMEFFLRSMERLAYSFEGEKGKDGRIWMESQSNKKPLRSVRVTDVARLQGNGRLRTRFLSTQWDGNVLPQ